MIIWLRECAAIVKRKGERGSPCLRPLEAEKKPLGVPFRRMEKWAVDRHLEIHFLHKEPNVFLAIT